MYVRLKNKMKIFMKQELPWNKHTNGAETIGILESGSKCQQWWPGVSSLAAKGSQTSPQHEGLERDLLCEAMGSGIVLWPVKWE